MLTEKEILVVCFCQFLVINNTHIKKSWNQSSAREQAESITFGLTYFVITFAERKINQSNPAYCLKPDALSWVRWVFARTPSKCRVRKTLRHLGWGPAEA